MRLITWNAEDAKRELSKRLQNARNSRQAEERFWEENENTIYQTKGGSLAGDFNVTELPEIDPQEGGVDNSLLDVGTNYAFKNLRFIHSQLSANPPSVAARPTSNDPDDRKKADAADRLIKYAIRKYKLQEKVDLCSLNTLLYGTGFIKMYWDSQLGEPIDIQGEEIILEGDVNVSIPSVWNIFLDPDATCWEEVRFVFERISMPFEEACFMFPEAHKSGLLERLRKKQEQSSNRGSLHGTKYDVVEFFEYHEKGLPLNGMVGRFTYCTDEGELLCPVKPHPNRFRPVREDVGDADLARKLPARAQLPYHIFTDVDVPSRVWGRSVVSYAASLQDAVNRLDNVTLDALADQAVPRLILPEGVELADESITNSPWDIIRTTGVRDPTYINPMTLPSSLTEMRMGMKAGIDDMQGVNENMFGQQSREQSGFSMQYATNQGNMIRRRLFNKYVFLVEALYKTYLNLIRKHWETEEIIYVLGKEQAFEAVKIKGADIDGGFDLVLEYGTSFSLDPVTRRQELINMMPIFEQAGVPKRTILQFLKLNELDGLHDTVQLAYDRQSEIFEEMLAKEVYIAPEELQDHPAMLEYAYRYIMTSAYKYLRDEEKQLIIRHIKEREQVAAQSQAQAQSPQAAAPAAPIPPAPPMEAQPA